MKMTSYLLLVMQVSIFLTVVSLGMRAGLSDITHLFRRPGPLLRAFASMYVIMPMFAILMIKTLNLNPVINVVLLALAVSPTPATFPKKALKSENASYAFGLLGAFMLFSVVTISLTFSIVEAIFLGEREILEPMTIKRTLVSVSLAMGFGMGLRNYAKPACDRLAGAVEKAGEVLFIASQLPIVIFLIPTIGSLIGNFSILVFLLFTLVGASVGYALGGPVPQERGLLALATASRHPAIVIALATSNAGDTPRQIVISAVVLYIIVGGMVTAPFIKWLSLKRQAL